VNFIKHKIRYFLFLPALFLGVLIYNNSHNVFLSDEWDTPGHLLLKSIDTNLSFQDFISQHNESRKIFPKVLYYSLSKISGLDITHVIFIRFGLSVLCFFLLLKLLKKQNYQIFHSFIISILLFSPTQALSHLTSIQVITLIPPLLIILFYYFYKKLNNLGLFLLYISNCLIATFSFANGMLIWIILFPAFCSELKNKVSYIRAFALLAVLCFFATLYIYFIDYSRPEIHPSILEGLNRPLKSLRYLFLWLGSPFAIAFSDSGLIGSVIGCTSLSVFLIFFTTHFISKTDLNNKISSFYKSPWIALIVYSFVSGLAASLGRSGLGVLQALSPQYPSMAIWFYIGCIGFISSSSHKMLIPLKQFSTYSLLAITLLSYPAGAEEMKKLGKRCEEGLLAVRLKSLIPNNPLFSWKPNYGLYPAKSHPVWERFEDLVNYNLIDINIYDKHKLNYNLSLKNEDLGGCFSYISRENHTEYWGWAFLPNKRRPADFILICKKENGKLVPFTSLLLKEKRPDVSKALNSFNHDDLWGYRKKIYHKSHTTPIILVAVNSKSLECFPLKLELSQSSNEENNQL
jgi:hypothetical protein